MALSKITSLREFPSIEELMQTPSLSDDCSLLPRPAVVEIVRDVVDDYKESFRRNDKTIAAETLHEAIRKKIRAAKRLEIGRVINATGIIVHTNLGRAPLPESIFEDIKKTVVGYGNIEFDLARGSRGKRGVACENYLALLSGAEAATVVNNCAAGLFLTLNTLANRKRVLISRGELVQIGGGFRIPDILKKSGAKLCEVGSTNITTIDDYRREIDDRTGMILKVHKSNFVQEGFTDEVDLKDLVTLGKEYQVPVFNDLGSGVFVDTGSILGHREPSVQQSVSAGADITSFSGDKMLGGSQAGLVVGRADLIAKIKKNPLMRAFRTDKITFSIIEKLLTMYLNGTSAQHIALWQLVSVPESELYKRGKALVSELGNPEGVSVEATRVYMGGGALPQYDLPSVAVVFAPTYKATKLLRQFREYDPPIIGRIEDDRFILDLKALMPADYESVTQAIRDVIGKRG